MVLVLAGFMAGGVGCRKDGPQARFRWPFWARKGPVVQAEPSPATQPVTEQIVTVDVPEGEIVTIVTPATQPVATTVPAGPEPLVVEPVIDPPFEPDPAMRLRDWEPVRVAAVPSGAVVAGPVPVTFGEYVEDTPAWAHPVVDPAMFVANTVLIPVFYIFQPPWQKRVYRGVEFDPSYTGLPAHYRLYEEDLNIYESDPYKPAR